MHTPSDVTAETSAIARFEMATSPVAFARVEKATSPVAFAVPETEVTPTQTEAVSLTTTPTQTLIHVCPEHVVLILPQGGGQLVAVCVLAVLQ